MARRGRRISAATRAKMARSYARNHGPTRGLDYGRKGVKSRGALGRHVNRTNAGKAVRVAGRFAGGAILGAAAQSIPGDDSGTGGRLRASAHASFLLGGQKKSTKVGYVTGVTLRAAASRHSINIPKGWRGYLGET